MITDHNKDKNKCNHCIDSANVKNELLIVTKDHLYTTEALDKEEQRLYKKYMKLRKRRALAAGYKVIATIDEDVLRVDMIDNVLKQEIPNSIFSVITDQYYSSCFMIQTGLVQLKKHCSQCAGKVGLYFDSGIGDFNYKCKCGEMWNYLDKTIWKDYNLDSRRILTILIMFLTGCKPIEIKKLLISSSREYRPLEKLIKKVISEYFVRNLPKFRGVVEIDESAFRSKSKTRAKNKVDKWVFGLYERERKIVYMEIVKNRRESTLIPIIQKICEPGTTIISDQWGSYNKLPDYGFPHYTVDHSRFFVNPHSREIHTQDIEISWGWAKYEIRRQNRIMHNLQEYLHLFCWKRQFKEYQDKVTETTALIKGFCEIFKDYQMREKKIEN
ncbi:hypothetical protein SteCoe_10386 [Stentor coeruleus]|uniref:ISXO2-like transposase domain-containing protein n=1 Tax=Stentor coeruleus TaxID=5963 RepID=A0A1R2CFM1_9CILI|nr:hypothetical protein SteCoe_10386 [Stentor coeruleus]